MELRPRSAALMAAETLVLKIDSESGTKMAGFVRNSIILWYRCQVMSEVSAMNDQLKS